MFRLIGTNEGVELWDGTHDIPLQLQNELLQLGNGMHMFAVGDPVLGWGYAVLDTGERCESADAATMRTLEDRYADQKRVSPMPRKLSRPSITYH
jgi:hypothetical protein